MKILHIFFNPLKITDKQNWIVNADPLYFGSYTMDRTCWILPRKAQYGLSLLLWDTPRADLIQDDRQDHGTGLQRSHQVQQDGTL
jgi:hypothetical protein